MIIDISKLILTLALKSTKNGKKILSDTQMQKSETCLCPHDITQANAFIMVNVVLVS